MVPDDQKPLIVNGITFPANLTLLKNEDDLEKNWEIKICYYLEIEHSCMGSFPAIISGTKRMVLCRDRDLLVKVWRILKPRSSRIVDNLYYIHKTQPVCYLAKCEWGDNYSEPIKLLTESEYELLMNPFDWGGMLIGAEISKDHFQKMIDESQDLKTPE